MLPLEWYPDWWVQHPVQRWLASEGSWIVLLWMVAGGWVLEIAAFARIGSCLPHREEAVFKSKTAWYALHVCWMIATFSAMSVGFWVYMSAFWACMALIPACVAAVLTRRRNRFWKSRTQGGLDAAP